MENIEIFKDIRGYEGLYRVSNLGRIYSIRTNKYLRLNKHKCGYLKTILFKDGKSKTFLVHRLVASNFIENPSQYREVNHIDGDKTNNVVTNLEWCTVSENTKHAYNNNLSGFRDMVLENLRKINESTMYRKIIFKKGNELLEFSSISKAADILGLKRDNITRAIRKKQKVSGYEVFGYKIANEEDLLVFDKG